MGSFMTTTETSRFMDKLRDGATPLMLAAKVDDLERCLKLLKKYSAAEKTHLSVSLLHFAATNKAHGLQIIEHLVSHGLRLKAEDVDGEDAVDYALRTFNFDLAQQLVGQPSLLQHFVEKDKLHFAKVVVERDPTLLGQKDKDGRSLVHLAAELSGLEMCRWLIRRGLDPLDPDPEGSTALHYAVLNELHAEQMVLFLTNDENRLDPNAINNRGESPLHWALVKQNLGVAEALLKVGARVEQQLLHFCVGSDLIKSAKYVHQLDQRQVLDGRHVMHIAAQHSTLRMCDWLRKIGARTLDLDRETHCSALHYAALNHTHGSKIVAHLLSLGLEVDGKDVRHQTPLLYALKVQNLEVAKVLLANGADLRIQLNGWNLLHVMVRFNNLLCAQFVHERDPQLIADPGKQGKTALHLAANHADEKMCEWLVKEGVRASVPCVESGNNALHYAVFNKNHALPLVQFFHSQGVDPNCRNKFGLTPLHVALEHGNMEVAEELVLLGASLDVCLDHSNLLHFCVCRNALVGAQFVHERNMELIGKNSNGGLTALHLAAQWADLEICEWLVQQGVNTAARDKFGQLAWQLVPDEEKQKKKYLKSLPRKNVEN